MSRTFPFLAVVIGLLAAPAQAAGEPAAPVTAWLGQDAILVLEVPRPRVLLDWIFQDRVVQAVTANPAYRAAAANAEFQQAVGFVKHLEAKYNTNLSGLLGKLLGGGITLAVCPQDAVLIAVDSEDAKMLEELHEVVLLIARSDAQAKGRADQIASAEYRGVKGWRFAPNESHALVGPRLLLTNKPERIKMALDLRADSQAASLATLPAYQAAKQAAGAEPVARLFVNTGVLKKLPQLDKALNRHENPLAALLAAPLLAAIRDSNWLTAGIVVSGQTVTFNFATDSAPVDRSAPEGFAAAESAQGGALPNFAVPRQIAGMSLYRDMHRFYAAKDKLFPDRTSGLIFFENMMGIFFTGRDLTDEVLAETGPEIRLVVAEQKYDAKIGTPRIQIPGFAFVFPMRHPDKFAPVMEEAWQKALGLINFTRGQKAEPGLILDRPIYGDVKYTMSYFAPVGNEDKSAVDLRFNFQPSLAMTAGHVILSSTEGLARDVMDALKKETQGGTKPVAGAHTILEVDGARVASILRANRENLIQQSMVEKGNPRAQAETETDMLLKITEAVRQVKLTMGSYSNQARLQLEVTAGLP